ncbi:MAG TPA: PIG-L family deacetylase, partial [Gordonia sp. (in: high G+C Gram-positive bacteria)]|nr:PIG-L family deacetylase [Gordonia sp. (in: high G+C Gram-positive bacteria)]
MAPRLLFVHAHPDDESLWTGGTIARHIAAGGDADLIVCTWAPGTSRHAEVVDAARIL